MIKNLLNESSDGFWDWDLRTNSFLVSQGLVELLGVSESEITGLTTLIRMLQDDDQEAFERALNHHLNTPNSRPAKMVLRLRHRSGDMIDVLFKGLVLDRDSEGTPLRVIGDYTNFTALFSMEEELQFRNENLQLVNKGINAGIWHWDVSSGVTSWSDRLFEMLGYQPNETETSYDIFMNQLVHPDHIEKLRSNLDDYLNHRGPYRIEFKCLCKDGKYRWFETHGAAKFDKDGKAIRMIGSMLDIDQRKQLEEKNLRSIESLTSGNQRLLNFAHIVSHNLRSNAANLFNLLEIFEEAEEDQKLEIRNLLKANADQLLQTIEHLADVVKIQTQLESKKQLLDFESVTNRIVTGLCETINAANIDISSDFHHAPEVECVPAYLESMLHNLISNAIKYRDPGKQAICSLTSKQTETHISLFCHDNGLGIDLDKHRHKIFGLYKTFHGNSDARGVGLFLMKSQIESMGGTIEVQSEPFIGSTFTICFPITS